jgi:hypothetical protein
MLEFSLFGSGQGKVQIVQNYAMAMKGKLVH